MTRDDRKLIELEKALKQLRDDLNDLSTRVAGEPSNTSLVIRRVNLMGRILTAQTSVDQLRDGLKALPEPPVPTARPQAYAPMN